MARKKSCGSIGNGFRPPIPPSKKIFTENVSCVSCVCMRELFFSPTHLEQSFSSPKHQKNLTRPQQLSNVQRSHSHYRCNADIITGRKKEKSKDTKLGPEIFTDLGWIINLHQISLSPSESLHNQAQRVAARRSGQCISSDMHDVSRCHHVAVERKTSLINLLRAVITYR